MILDAGYLTYYRKTEWKCYESKKPLIGRQKAVFWIIKDGLLHSKRAHVTALIPTYGYVFCAKNYLFWQIFDFNIHDVEKKEKTIIFANKNETLYRHNIHGITNGSEPYKKSDNQTLPATRMNVSNEVCTRVF